MEWREANGIAWKISGKDGVDWWNARLEHYLKNQNDESDPKKWKTEVAVMVADS